MIKKHILILSLVIVFLCLTPASAYTQLATYTLESSCGSGHVATYATTYPFTIIVDNASAFSREVTRIVSHMDNLTTYSYIVPSGTYTDEVRLVSVPYGTYTATWAFGGGGSSPKTLDLDISLNFTSYANPGSSSFRLNNLSKNMMTTGGDIDSRTPCEVRADWAGGVANGTLLAPFYTWSSSYVTSGTYTSYGGLPNPPEADFTATPTSGRTPQTIILTDTSTNGTATSWNWSGTGPGSMFFSGITTKDTSVYLATTGNYTITHCAANAVGSDCETKTDYIWIYDDNSTVITGFMAIDGTSGYPINGAQVDLYDIENTSWTNTTTIGGHATITTLGGHNINAYGSASGYGDGDLLNQPAIDQKLYSILMFPDNQYKNVTAGWVTLYVHVIDADNTHINIPGASVFGGDQNYGILQNSTPFGITTNSAGIASVIVQNQSNIYLTVSKAGYSTRTQVVYSGTGSGGNASVTATVLLPKATVSPTVTLTAGPGGTVPVTADPAGTPDPSGKPNGYSNAKGQQMLDWLAENGMSLVQLCFVVTIMALFGFKFGR